MNEQMKKLFKALFFIFFIFTLLNLTLQENNSNSEKSSKFSAKNEKYTKLDSLPYLGQTPPDTVPEKFSPGFISSAGAAEYSICFSQDGKEIYFSRNTVGVSNTIWWTYFNNGAWSTPVLAPFTGSYYNSEPFITYDNQKMYFISARDTSTNYQIYFMSRNGSNWTTPVKLGVPFSLDKTKMFPTLAANGNIYFTQWDLASNSYFYTAKNINGVFYAPVKLNPNINAFFIHGHIFVAPDESFLVFDVIPTQQSTGSMIYASFKNADSTWGNPIRLSNTINSTGNQYCPYLSPDGKYLFFTQGGDLWWVDSKVVTRHKPVGIIKTESEIPNDCKLYQNYPNPFNPSSTIGFQISESRFISLKIYDISGKEIATLVNEKLAPGKYEVPFSIDRFSNSSISSGVYFYTLKSDDFADTKKMIYLK